jgi:Telomerase activating protein Est1
MPNLQVTQDERRLIDLEDMFRNLLKQRVSTLITQGMFEKNVQLQRVILRDRYQELILNDFVGAIETQAESNLWKLIHYKFIEDFRKQLKAEVSKLKHGQSKTVDDRRDWKLLSASFRAFLTDSSTFYLHFVQRLIHVYGLTSLNETVLQPLQFALSGDAGIPFLSKWKAGRYIKECQMS